MLMKCLKVETVSTYSQLKVETVSTFSKLKVETVSTINHLKVETLVISFAQYFLTSAYITFLMASPIGSA